MFIKTKSVILHRTCKNFIKHVVQFIEHDKNIKKNLLKIIPIARAQLKVNY